MKRVRVEKPRGRRKRSGLQPLPLDPRDPDLVRAKSKDRHGSRIPFPVVRDDEDA
jgi:hypothetical protein